MSVVLPTSAYEIKQQGGRSFELRQWIFVKCLLRSRHYIGGDGVQSYIRLRFCPPEYYNLVKETNYKHVLLKSPISCLFIMTASKFSDIWKWRVQNHSSCYLVAYNCQMTSVGDYSSLKNIWKLQVRQKCSFPSPSGCVLCSVSYLNSCWCSLSFWVF